MAYDCKQLTEGLKRIQEQKLNLDGFVEVRNVKQGLESKESIESVTNEIIESVDKFKIHIRKRIAKKYDLSEISCLPGGHFVGTGTFDLKEDGIQTRSVLIDREGKIISDYHGAIYSSNGGACITIDSQPAGPRYKIINEDGNIIKDLTEALSIQGESTFSDAEPIVVELKNNKLAFVKTNGELILEDSFTRQEQRFHEGLIFIQAISQKDTFYLYDTNVKLIKTITNLQMVSGFSHGFAIGLENAPDSDLLLVVLIDQEGTIRRTNHLVENSPQIKIGSVADKYYIRDNTPSPLYYFTKDGPLHQENNDDSSKHIMIDPISGDTVYYFKKKTSSITEVIVTKRDTLVLSDRFEQIVNYQEGFLECVSEDETYHFVDKNGRYLHTKEELIAAYPFRNGFARVKDKNGWFLIDTNGNDVFNAKRFDRLIDDVNQGVISTIIDGGKMFLDCHGNKVWGE